VILAAVIPAYNEAATLRGVAERTLPQVDLLIVIDDASTDGTRETIAGLPLSLLANAANLGKGASLCRGIAHALAQGADAVVTLDGDGQHAPEDIPRLRAAAELDRKALVIGSRLHESHKIPRDRYLAQRVGDFCIGWAARRAIPDSQCGFRIYPAAMFRTVTLKTDSASGFVFESEILIDAARAGIEIVSVPVAAIYEPRGRRSHFRPVKDFCCVGAMVTRKIVQRGFDLPGLVRSLRDAAPRSHNADSTH
jgi:glycosyltransferase involved in cell wall biosynthesis